MNNRGRLEVCSAVVHRISMTLLEELRMRSCRICERVFLRVGNSLESLLDLEAAFATRTSEGLVEKVFNTFIRSLPAIRGLVALAQNHILKLRQF